MQTVTIKNIGGVHVPLQPWPQVFYVSRELFDIKAVELRPLTLTGLVKGVGKNLVTMNFWRLCYLLLRAGFLRTPEGEMFSIHDWTWKFWKPQPPQVTVSQGAPAGVAPPSWTKPAWDEGAFHRAQLAESFVPDYDEPPEIAHCAQRCCERSQPAQGALHKGSKPTL